MSKHSIGWHEECIRNSRRFYEGETAKAKSSLKRAENALKYLEVAEAQLAEAKRRGLSGYDADRFMRKRAA